MYYNAILIILIIQFNIRLCVSFSTLMSHTLLNLTLDIGIENDAHKLQWDFDIQTDNLISARKPDLIIINNKRELAKLPSQLTKE